MRQLVRCLVGALLLAGAALAQIVVAPNVVGPPTGACTAGQITYQTDAAGAPWWLCKDRYTWTNPATGQASYVAQSCKYWVDSVGGSDSNTGASKAQAWATITKLNTVTFAANDIICMVAGSSWEGQSSSPNSVSGLQLYAQGVGVPPDIVAAAIAANASFTLTNSCPDTYQITVSPTFGASSGEDFVNVWENGVAFPRAALSGGCLATPGTYFPSSDNGPGTTAITIYIKASDSSDIITNGNKYEYGSQEYALKWLGITNAIVANVKTEKNLGIDGSAGFGQNATLYNVWAWHGNKHNLYCQSGCAGFGLQAYGAYYNSASTMIIVADTNALSIGASCTNCTAGVPSYESPWSNLIEGFGLHAVSSGNFGTVALTNFIATGIGTGAAGGDATASTFTNLVCNGCLTGINPGSSSNGNYTGGTATINGLVVTGGNYAIEPTASGVTVTATGVAFYSTNTGSSLFYCPATLASCILNLTDSMLAGTPWYGVQSIGTSNTIALGGAPGAGNNFSAATIKYVDTGAGTTTMNYNNYAPGTSATWLVGGTAYLTWGALQGAGYEANGTQP